MLGRGGIERRCANHLSGGIHTKDVGIVVCRLRLQAAEVAHLAARPIPTARSPEERVEAVLYARLLTRADHVALIVEAVASARAVPAQAAQVGDGAAGGAEVAVAVGVEEGAILAAVRSSAHDLPVVVDGGGARQFPARAGREQAIQVDHLSRVGLAVAVPVFPYEGMAQPVGEGG